MHTVSWLYRAVVGGPTDADLEEFKQHCQITVKCFYEEGVLEINRLNAIKRQLVAESKRLRHRDVDSKSSQTVLGSCGEYFLKCRLLDMVGDIACITDPPGLLKFALEWTSELISEIPDFMLAHTAVSKPLIKILSVGLSEPQILLSFLAIVIQRLKLAPHLSRILLLDPSESGHEMKFAPFRILAVLYKDPKLRASVVPLIQTLVHFCGDEALDMFPGTKMVNVLVDDLVFLYQEIAPFILTNNLNMGHYLKHLEFLSTLSSVKHYATFRSELLRSIRKRLLRGVIGPRLYEGDLLVVNACVVYLREVLLHLGPRSPLSHEFIRFIFRGPSPNGVEKASLLIDRFLDLMEPVRLGGEKNINRINATVSTNVMRLFSTILTFKIKYGAMVSNFIKKDLVHVVRYSSAASTKDSRLHALHRLSKFIESEEDIRETREFDFAIKLSRSSQLKLKTFSESSLSDSTGLPPMEPQKSLISSLVDAFRKFDTNSFEYNIYLTDCVSKLCLFPDPSLHSFLLEAEDPRFSLSTVLHMLCEDYKNCDVAEGREQLEREAGSSEYPSYESALSNKNLYAALFHECLIEIIASLTAVHDILEDVSPEAVS